MLTSAQVGTVIGGSVAAGTHVTPTFIKTRTWNASGNSNVKFVTLYLQTAAACDGGNRMAAEMAAASAGVKPAAVGDNACYFVAGSQVGLLVKHGEVSFKVTVQATLPVDKKEAMELTLAQEALAKLSSDAPAARVLVAVIRRHDEHRIGTIPAALPSSRMACADPVSFFVAAWPGNRTYRMKTMTCKELGGPCDHRMSAGSWEEMVKSMTAHVMEKHPDTAKAMKKMHEEDPRQWGREMKPKWDAAPSE